MSVTVATRYVIMRGLKTSCTIVHSVPEEPIRVVTIRNEELFLATGEMTHHASVFFEDRLHDWQWNNGKFRYFARQNDDAVVALVYEEKVIECKPIMNFCHFCGVKLADHPGHDVMKNH